MNKEGNLDMWEKRDWLVMQEFGFCVTDMATEIQNLRDEIEKKDKEIEKLNKQD